MKQAYNLLTESELNANAKQKGTNEPNMLDNVHHMRVIPNELKSSTANGTKEKNAQLLIS